MCWLARSFSPTKPGGPGAPILVYLANLLQGPLINNQYFTLVAWQANVWRTLRTQGGFELVLRGPIETARLATHDTREWYEPRLSLYYLFARERRRATFRTGVLSAWVQS